MIASGVVFCMIYHGVDIIAVLRARLTFGNNPNVSPKSRWRGISSTSRVLASCEPHVASELHGDVLSDKYREWSELILLRSRLCEFQVNTASDNGVHRSCEPSLLKYCTAMTRFQYVDDLSIYRTTSIKKDMALRISSHWSIVGFVTVSPFHFSIFPEIRNIELTKSAKTN
jgi:hypothetical protein